MQGLRLVAPAFLLPFLFSYDSALLLQNSEALVHSLAVIVVALLIFVSLPIILFRHYFTDVGWAEIMLAALSVAGFMSYFLTRGKMAGLVVGGACFILLNLGQWRKTRRQGVITGEAVVS